MHKRIISLLLGGLALALLVGQLQPVRTARAANSGYDLVAAVNALRRSKGLAELKVDGALMNSAQGHSDYQASIGSWTHTGPGGSTPTSRAKAAGFGGGATVFISENVAYNTLATTLDYVIYTVWSDALHWNTMVNPTYTHAGGGVTVKGNYVYFTLDVGYIAGQPGATARPTSAPGTSVPTQPLLPTTAAIITSTRNPDGSVYHPVQYGQFLMPIAQAYGLTLSQIRQINNMGPDDLLYAGQKLLIQPSFTPTLSPTVTRTSPPPTRTLTPTVPSPTPTVTATLTVTPTPTAPSPLAFLESTDRQTLAFAILGVSGLGLLLVLLSILRRKK